MEKILVTGAKGYLGTCVFEVLSWDKTNSVHKLEGRLEEIVPNSLKYDLVVHCAGALRHREGQHQKSNTEGTKKLIAGLSQRTKLIYISSKSIYGTKLQGRFTEQNYPQPDDDYGRSKYEGELEILKSKQPYIILRSSTLFGLGINNLGPAFPSKAMLELYEGNDIKLHTPDVAHEYLFVRDLAQIISKLKGLTTCWNHIFNVSGKQKPLSELVYSIENHLKINANCRGQIIKTVKRLNPCFFLDSSKLCNVIGEDMLTPTNLVVQEMAYYINEKHNQS
jgi:dTDP-4-dehydrorhamnose reductase